MKRVFFMITLLLLCHFTAAHAQIPETLTYQGALTDASGKALPDGSYNLTFKLYDAATGGTALWTEAQTVEVKSGVFDVILGSRTALNLAFDKQYWLGLVIGTGTELSPRTRLTATAYSMNARTVSDNAVTANKIAGGQVVKSVNGLKDDVNLTAGNNVTIDKTGNTLKISAQGGTGGGNGWTVAGNDVTTNVSGNVGIGLSTPTLGRLVVKAGGTAPLFDDIAHFTDGTADLRFDSFNGNINVDNMNPKGNLYIGRAMSGGGYVSIGNSIVRDVLVVPITGHPNVGNVGIGTTEPKVQLHIDGKDNWGQVAIWGATGADLSLKDPNAGADVKETLLRNQDGKTYFASLTEAGAIGQSFLTMDHINGNVGIGTHSATQGRLVVKAGGSAPLFNDIAHFTDGTADLRLDSFNGHINLDNINPAGNLNIGRDMIGGGLVSIGNWRGSGALVIPIAGHPRNGNIGIGTTDPAFRLELNAGTESDIVRLGHVPGISNGFMIQKDAANNYSYTFDKGNVNIVGTTTTKVLTITGGADLAEPFAMTNNESIEPGAVVIIDEANPGQLKLSEKAYDTRVAGIISGAGGVNPGLTLSQEDQLGKGQNVALSGRVYAKATAANGAIKPGDLLTTSDVPGHAMKANDIELRNGAILGKAMTALEAGEGLVLVLVCLQ